MRNSVTIRAYRGFSTQNFLNTLSQSNSTVVVKNRDVVLSYISQN